MSDREPGQDRPSLELPSLGGWRHRRREQRAARAARPSGSGSGSVPPAATEPEPPPNVTPDRREQPTIVLPEAAAPTDAETAPGSRRLPIRARRSGGPVVVVLVGAVVGLAVVGLTWASLRTCEQVRGTSSCGTAGYPLLVLVLALAVVVGGVLLRLARVSDPVSTSILGVGLASVVALLFLVDSLDEPAMVVVIPVIAALTFAASHWVTTTFVEPGER
ncbi:hypothetical protein [Nocardioides sp. YIM 152315]|uniref:hypothetical protein n=1 Tax=Nocardioides sp. YIM 152315 TaxID=3031760 RepID=UPI0023DA278B|nr:hypothetical protein [Nocardioides sp. YIM 152315]MDF1605238.1 hypothetical protein [Nocardioides sp. YIM 152315]